MILNKLKIKLYSFAVTRFVVPVHIDTNNIMDVLKITF